MKYLLILISLMAVISVSCKNSEKSVKINEIIKEVRKQTQESTTDQPIQKAEINQNNPATDTEFISLVKRQLPKLRKGMNTDQVFNILYLDTKFNGIVSSDGERENFIYYYELDGLHELRLNFDYSQEGDGSFLKYRLIERG